MTYFNPTRIFSLACLLLALAACQEKEPQDLKDFVDSAYRDERPEIKPLPTSRPYKPFAYTAVESTDPFGTGNIINEQRQTTIDGQSPDQNRRREELEQYPLDALKLVGTLTGANQPWVIVQTADGRALRATVGNYMGQNDGKITEIHPEEQRVVLAELVLDPAGRWVTRELDLTIDE